MEFNVAAEYYVNELLMYYYQKECSYHLSYPNWCELTELDLTAHFLHAVQFITEYISLCLVVCLSVCPIA